MCDVTGDQRFYGLYDFIYDDTDENYDINKYQINSLKSEAGDFCSVSVLFIIVSRQMYIFTVK